MKPISQKHPPDLSYLVRLCVATIALQVYSLADTRFPENVMAAPCPLTESQAQQEHTEIVESDISV